MANLPTSWRPKLPLPLPLLLLLLLLLLAFSCEHTVRAIFRAIANVKRSSNHTEPTTLSSPTPTHRRPTFALAWAYFVLAPWLAAVVAPSGPEKEMFRIKCYRKDLRPDFCASHARCCPHPPTSSTLNPHKCAPFSPLPTPKAVVLQPSRRIQQVVL